MSASKDWQNLLNKNPKLAQFDIIETPNFIAAYKEVNLLQNVKQIDPKLAFKLYDTYGIDEDGIEKLANALNLKFDPDDLKKELEDVRLKLKESFALNNKLYLNILEQNLPKTEDSFKYAYSKSGDNNYLFKNLEIKILRIFEKEQSVQEIPNDHYCSLLLDKTNLYSEAGGQISDKGTIKFSNGTFDVTSVENVAGYILHKGFFKSKNNTALQINSVGNLEIDHTYRLNCMKNHTGTHLLNASLKNLACVTCQKSSKVTPKYLNFDVALFGDKLTVDQLQTIENEVQDIIRKQKPVIIREINSQELLSLDSVTLIPGEVYPENGIRIIEIIDDKFLSRYENIERIAILN